MELRKVKAKHGEFAVRYLGSERTAEVVAASVRRGESRVEAALDCIQRHDHDGADIFETRRATLRNDSELVERILAAASGPVPSAAAEMVHEVVAERKAAAKKVEGE